MSTVVRTVLALMALLALSVGPAAAQAKAGEDTFKQVELSEKLVLSFIAGQKEISEYHQKAGPPTSDKPDPKVVADLDAIAKKHGFASYSDFDDVAFNVSMVMGGLDPQSGAFTDPIAAIKKEMEEIEKDSSIPEKDKKQMLDELAEALKSTPAMKFPGNVELVKKHRADIEKVLQ
jgi:hypothetical protein